MNFNLMPLFKYITLIYFRMPAVTYFWRNIGEALCPVQFVIIS